MYSVQAELVQKMIRESLLKIISRQKKGVLVTSFASNVARMETIFYIAKKLIEI